MQVMITTVIPAAVHESALSTSIHVSCSIPESTAISLAAACRTHLIAARARDAREIALKRPLSASELNSVAR